MRLREVHRTHVSVPVAARAIPPDGVRLSSVLADHAGLVPVLNADKPSIPIWVVEDTGEVQAWLLLAVGERTVTVVSPRDRHDRALRHQRHVWIRPGAIVEWARFVESGPRGQGRVTFSRAQAAKGRQMAMAKRKALEAAKA